MSRGFEGRPAENPNSCTDPYSPSFWLGKPGALTQIRMPDGGWPRASDDNFAVHDLLDGQAVDRSPYLRRTWEFGHQWLKPDVMSVFMEYATRQRGFGPFILIDPQMKNLLSPNQASGTDSLHTTEGFSVTGSAEALSSSVAWAAQGERSLAWTWTPAITGTAGVLRLPTQTGLYGFVLPVGSIFAFSGQIRGGVTADLNLNVIPQVVLMNAVGAVQSTVRSGIISAVTGSATPFCVTGVVPAASLGTYLEPQFAVTGSPVSGIMNANPYFETDVSNWTPQNGASVVRDGTFHEGAFAMLITPDGVGSGPQVISEEMTVVPGNSYRANCWLRISGAGSGSRTVGIIWYNSSHAQISQDSITLSPAVTVWTQFTQVFQAPVGAVFARLVTSGPGVLAAANTWRVDEFYLQSTKQTNLMFDQLQLEITPTGACTQWEYGQGQPLVGVRAVNESVPRVLRTNMGYVAVEVT